MSTDSASLSVLMVPSPGLSLRCAPFAVLNQRQRMDQGVAQSNVPVAPSTTTILKPVSIIQIIEKATGCLDEAFLTLQVSLELR